MLRNGRLRAAVFFFARAATCPNGAPASYGSSSALRRTGRRGAAVYSHFLHAPRRARPCAARGERASRHHRGDGAGHLEARLPEDRCDAAERAFGIAGPGGGSIGRAAASPEASFRQMILFWGSCGGPDRTELYASIRTAMLPIGASYAIAPGLSMPFAWWVAEMQAETRSEPDSGVDANLRVSHKRATVDGCRTRLSLAHGSRARFATETPSEFQRRLTTWQDA